MTSLKQIKANRKNGKLGGVKTQQGKEIIRRNALKHGITSNILIDPEEQSTLNQIRHDLMEEYRPIGTMETFWVERIALCMFRLQKCSRLEDQYFFTINNQNQKEQKTFSIFPQHLLRE